MSTGKRSNMTVRNVRVRWLTPLERAKAVTLTLGIEWRPRGGRDVTLEGMGQRDEN